jgi:hypothetical protein
VSLLYGVSNMSRSKHENAAALHDIALNYELVWRYPGRDPREPPAQGMASKALLACKRSLQAHPSHSAAENRTSH